MKYEKLFLEEIHDVLDLVRHTEGYRTTDYNTVRPHETLAWNRPHDVHLSLADPHIPNYRTPKTCQLLDVGHHQYHGAQSTVILQDIDGTSYVVAYPGMDQLWNYTPAARDRRRLASASVVDRAVPERGAVVCGGRQGWCGPSSGRRALPA